MTANKIGKVDFLNIIEQTFNRMLELSDTKGKEYTSDKDTQNQHENFDRAADRMKLTPEQVLQVNLDKHISSIYTWIARISDRQATSPPVMSEPMDGRIDDAILYLILLKAMYFRRSEPVPPAKELSPEQSVPSYMEAAFPSSPSDSVYTTLGRKMRAAEKVVKVTRRMAEDDPI